MIRRPITRTPCVETLEVRRLLSYTVTELGSLGGVAGVPLEVNNRGAVVGFSFIANNAAAHAFLFKHGKMTDLGTLGGTESEAMGINDSGEIVGLSQVAPGSTQWDLFTDRHGKRTDLGAILPLFVSAGVVSINNSGTVSGFSESNGDAGIERHGKLIDLGSLAGLGSVARALNDGGDVVGLSPTTFIPGSGGSSSPAVTYHAFLYSHRKMTDLGTLGGPNSQANDLNDRGVVAGWSAITGNTADHAFVYQHGHMHDLGTLGGSDSVAAAINDGGMIVGASITADSGFHGFIEKHGKLIDLNTLIPANSGIVITNAQDINDRGQIAAQGFEANSPATDVAVLLSPKRSSK